MNNFTFFSPTRIVFGRGVTDSVGPALAELGYRRALVVYGKGSVVRTGTLERVRASLARAGVTCVELGGVRPNPEIGLCASGHRYRPGRTGRRDCSSRRRLGDGLRQGHRHRRPL